MAAGQVVTIARNATKTWALSFTLPVGDLSLASEITLILAPDDGSTSLELTITDGDIVVTSATDATATLSESASGALALGRYRWYVWIDLNTGESYQSDSGFAVVTDAGR